MSAEGGEPIPLVDLRAAHAEVADEVAAGMARVVESTAFVLGPEVEAFEREFAAFSGARHCVGVSNGTDALELALRALGIGPGDEVLVPANTFVASALAVVRAGATPVLADCDPEHLLLDADDAARRITARTRAVMPVHLYGQMAPMEAVADLARAHDLAVVEDCAQAQGATRAGRPAGAWSAVAATSFYPGKNLGAYGDAGAVLTDDDDLAAAVRALRAYGSTRKYEHPVVGFNCRLDALQAVVLRAKLRRLAEDNARRRAAAARYVELLAPLDEVRPVATAPGNEHVFHLFVVRLPGGPGRRGRVLEALAADGIGAGIHYPEPLHLTGAFAGLGHARGAFPAAEAACDSVLSLPLYPQITPAQQERVVASLRRALGATR